MQLTELQTARTVMRPFSEEDAMEAFSWFGDPVVMKFTPHGSGATLESTIERIEHYLEHQSKYGCSKWIILERNSMKSIGDAGPMYFPECQSFELGYKLLPDYWNKGLAIKSILWGWKVWFLRYRVYKLKQLIFCAGSQSTGRTVRI